MVKQKRRILTFVPTDKNLIILKNMGFLNKHGRSTGRLNLNDFINRAIQDKVGIDDSKQNPELLERVLLDEIRALQDSREKFCKDIEQKLLTLASKLEEHRKQTPLSDYYEDKVYKESDTKSLTGGLEYEQEVIL